MNHDSPPRSPNSRETKSLQQQLVTSLKFHHKKTLQQIPLEVALQAMMEAWNATQLDLKK